MMTDAVRGPSPVVSMLENRKSFQPTRKARNISEVMIGLASGSMTRQNALNAVQPYTMAHSSRNGGNSAK